MHKILVPIFSFLAYFGFTQTPNNCGNYTSTGTIGSIYIPGPNAACNANVPGTVTGSGAWTGGTCAGNIVTSVVGPPVTCLTVSYTSVNTNDFATLTTDTGGSLTITGVNVGISGNVIGPYQCTTGSGTSGDVLVNICSTVPFSVLTLTNTGCASGWIINCATSTLPVEFAGFQAKTVENDYVRLSWKSVIELNNDYFVIERSYDAINFEPLKTIDGAGNSSVELEYSEYDRQPLLGTSYYRIKQVDFDGTYSYSDTRSVFINDFEFVNLYPNPVENELNIDVSVERENVLQVEVLDFLGRKVLDSEYLVSADDSGIKLDVSELESGVYILRLGTNGANYQTSQFVRR